MHCENKTRVIILNRYDMDKSLNVKNFAAGCYGVFENGQFITSRDEFDKMIEQATMIANEGKSTVTISTLNFAGNEEQYGVFENGQFITSRDEFDKMIEQATMIANEGKSTVTISTLNFAGNEEQPTIIEGTVIMKFYKVYDTVYISNQLD